MLKILLNIVLLLAIFLVIEAQKFRYLEIRDPS